MKKVAILFAALLFAAPAFGQGSLYYSWSNCSADAGAVNTVNLDCAGGNSSTSFATFQLTAGAPGAVALTGVIDLRVEGVSDLPPFWRMEAGGCNGAALGIDDTRGGGLCTSVSAAFPTNSGAATDAFITAFGVNFGGVLTRARLLTSVVRASSNPVDLVAGTRYFAFKLNWFTDAAEACTGCGTTVGMALNTILLESALTIDNDAVAAVIQSDDPSSSPSLCVNNATCGTVPVRTQSWGRIKSLYR